MDSERLRTFICLTKGVIINKAVASGEDGLPRTAKQYWLVVFVCIMRVAVFTGIDGPDNVTVQETDDPMPASGEVVLNVEARSINRHDLWILEGDSVMVDTDDLPFVSGLDVAGEMTKPKRIFSTETPLPLHLNRSDGSPRPRRRIQ